MTNLRQAAWCVSAVLLLSLVGCSAKPDQAVPPSAPDAQDPNADSMLAVGACLEELGWEVTDAANGIVKVAPEQVDVFNEDFNECSEEVQGGAEVAPMTDTELAEYYPFVVEEAQCLKGLGYDIEIPSMQVFLDTYQEDPYVPRAEAAPFSQSEYQQLEESCPAADWEYQKAGS